ncbi:hypothetical protein JCM3766R1_001700 [Sporobolomyces carnicolor]
MLSSLPTELLAHIIESAVPHTRFRAIAQPLLNDIAWFPTIQALELAAANERLRFTVAIFGGLKYKWLEDVTRFGEGTLSVAQSLTLYRGSFGIGFEWPPAAFLSHLRCLQLHEIYYDIPDNLVLPHIESLCLGGLNFRSSMLERLLNPTALPALRHFALSDEVAASSVLTRIEGILPQLETITLDLDVWSDLAPESRKLAVGRALVNCDIERYSWPFSSRIPVAHLRMYDIVDLSKGTLKAIVDLLKPRPLLELQTIYLDCSLLTIPTSHYLVDWFISPEFVRRQKMAIRGGLSKRGGTHKA